MPGGPGGGINVPRFPFPRGQPPSSTLPSFGPISAQAVMPDGDSMAAKATVSTPGQKVLVVGDSVPWQFAGTRDPTGLTALAALMGITPSTQGLGPLGFEVTNAALPGSGPARQDIQNPYTWADTHYLANRITAFSPAKVVISFGGNTDVFANDQHTTGVEPRMSTRWQLESVAGFQDIIGDARAAKADTDIVVVAGWRVGPYPDGTPEGQAWANSLNWFGQYLLSTVLPAWPNIKVVNVSDIDPFDSRYRLDDHIHLTDAGCLLVAQRIAGQLNAVGVATSVEPTLPATLPAPTLPADNQPSDRFRVIVAESHEEVTVVEVLRPDIPDTMATLKCLQGSHITFAAGDASRRSASLELIDPTGAVGPAEAEDLLNSPAEVRIRSGPRFPEGTTELKRCGIYKVVKFELTNSAGKWHYRLTCLPRSARAAKAFGSQWSTIAGAKLEDAIRDMVRSKAPTLPMNLPATGLTVPLLVFPGTANPLAEAQKLASWAGYILEDNDDGVLIMSTAIIDVAAVADWNLVEDARSTAWDVERSREEAPNHIIVKGTGTGAGASVVGEAKDTDPLSPSSIQRVGDILKEVSDPRITSTAMATRAAVSILGRGLGAADTIPCKMLPNPALRLDQTVFVDRPKLGVSTFALVDHFELPLVAGPNNHMTVTVRRGVRTDADLITQVVNTL